MHSLENAGADIFQTPRHRHAEPPTSTRANQPHRNDNNPKMFVPQYQFTRERSADASPKRKKEKKKQKNTRNDRRDPSNARSAWTGEKRVQPHRARAHKCVTLARCRLAQVRQSAVRLASHVHHRGDFSISVVITIKRKLTVRWILPSLPDPKSSTPDGAVKRGQIDTRSSSQRRVQVEWLRVRSRKVALAH